jgi:hypothetical protein
VVAATGSGKTNIMSNFLKFYQDKQYETKKIFDAMCLVSPSSFPNEMGFKSENKFDSFDWDEIHSEFNPATMKLIIKNQKARLQEYLKYQNDLKTYNKLMNDKKVDNKILLDYFEKYPELEKPTCRYERLPLCVIVMDDVVNANKLSELSQFISRSRHLNCSFMTACQSLTNASLHLRQNISCLILLKTSNSKTIETIYDEFVSCSLNKEQWFKMCELPRTKYEFVMIDLKEADVNKQFRYNFDQFINVSKPFI